MRNVGQVADQRGIVTPVHVQDIGLFTLDSLEDVEGPWKAHQTHHEIPGATVVLREDRPNGGKREERTPGGSTGSTKCGANAVVRDSDVREAAIEKQALSAFVARVQRVPLMWIPRAVRTRTSFVAKVSDAAGNCLVTYATERGESAPGITATHPLRRSVLQAQTSAERTRADHEFAHNGANASKVLWPH